MTGDYPRSSFTHEKGIEMLVKRFTAFITLLLLAVIPQLVLGQSAGKISGKVTDDKTGEALPGATVFLKGTSMGASTGLNGNYAILSVPPGSYTMRVSYVGYRNREIPVKLKAGEHLIVEAKLEAVGIQGKAVVVTAQASGQNAAINQELSSHNIVNVVSAARIQELPDANAAESIGRLPGVFLVRSYGEGAQIAIRGLQPKYNRVEIDGVEMPSTDNSNRSVDMSMISSDMLSGIQLFKTVTPDMDAAVLGGTVNLEMQKAAVTPTDAPQIELWGQGGYDNLQGTYNDYKFFGSIGKRFFNNRFGVLAQVVVQKQNLTADIFGGSYGNTKSDYYNPGPIIMNSLNLTYKPTEKRLYDGQLTLDYKWGSGNIDLMNFLSQGTQTTSTFGQNYNLGNANTISYQASSYTPITNVIMNILHLHQDILSFQTDVRLSHSYTENINPGYWSVGFTQAGAGVSSINEQQNPETIGQLASAFAIDSTTYFDGLSTNTSFTRQRNIGGSIDFEKDITFSDLVSAKLKFGGMYRMTYRSYVYSDGNGTLLAPGNFGARAAVIAANPWMQQSPYNQNPNGNDEFPITMFFNPSSSFGTFLGGNYTMLGSPTNLGVLSSIVNTVMQYAKNLPPVTAGPYSPSMYDAINNNYSGHEYRDAAYVMATVNIGPRLSLIPGVRYQGLTTSYTGPHVFQAYENNTYPYPYPHTDTTATEYHGYFLPDVILSYKPTSWFNIRAAYTNTLSYPDFSSIVPRIDIFLQSVNWNNYLLKPARSQNYDLALAFYNNTIGLFTVDPFLKQIDNMIFSTGGFGIINPASYPGLPAYTKNYILSSTSINNPDRVNLWGIELNWQTHFWYLPSVLSGLVMNVNYTHIFSGAKYPFTMTERGGFPPTISYVDTFYTDRLIDQPTDIVNLSVGYDYQGFSARVSMIYQANVYSGTSFWPQLRTHTATYTRWDFSAKQKLPWYGLQLYADINNLNGEPDITVVQGNGFPTSEQSYGLTGDFGIRWSL